MNETRESILEKLEKDGRLVIRREDYSTEVAVILGQLYDEGRIHLIIMNEAVIVQSRPMPDPSA